MVEGVDYYFNEQGLMVFKAAYHLKRGSCCKNKCLHCPWNFGKTNNQEYPKSSITQEKTNGSTTERSKSSEI